MQLTCHCPACYQPLQLEVGDLPREVVCTACGHARTIAADAVVSDTPTRCLGCGNGDLWRQKDFPARLGLLMVALGAILSSIAYAYYRPVIALSILAAFAIADMVLFWVMPDVLVCYRCGARHRVAAPPESFQPYDHELGERYRQERLRVEQQQPGGRHPAAG